jgi:hypothetical protein
MSPIKRFIAAALVAGSAIGATALPASADHHRGDRDRRGSVEITAVRADSPGPENRSNRSLNGEWVQVTNKGRQSVSLRGWTLRDEDRNVYTFRGNVRLAPRQSVLVHSGRGHDGRGHVYQGRHNYVWDNHGETATLRDARGKVVDAAHYGRGGSRR